MLSLSACMIECMTFEPTLKIRQVQRSYIQSRTHTRRGEPGSKAIGNVVHNKSNVTQYVHLANVHACEGEGLRMRLQ